MNERRSMNHGQASFLLLIATGLFGSTHASAENLPLSLSVIETLSRDSNLYRVQPTEYSIADTVSSTGLKLGLDKSYGRQRYVANFETYANRYFDSTQLNNTSYEVNLNITSEFLDKGLLQISGNAKQNLTRFDVASNNNTEQSKNIQTSSYFDSLISYGGYGSLNPYFDFTHLQQGFTYTNSNYQAYNLNSFAIGTNYAIAPQLSVGIGIRHVRGDIDYDALDSTVIDQMRRNSIDLTSTWAATGLSKLTARLSATRSKDKYQNSLTDSSENKGWTGDINWEYTPQGRMSYTLEFKRDYGNQGQAGKNIDMESLSLFNYNTENNRLSNILNMKATWEATSKIRLNASASYTKYHLDVISSETGASTSSTTNHSRYTIFSVGGQYEFARWANLYCDIKRIKRTRDAEYTPFNSTVTACTGQFNINGMN